MDTDKLVHMAGEMAGFFRSYPDDEASRGIADHIKAFWTPKMRQALMARVAADPTGIDPLVVQAMAAPPQAPSPIDKELAGP